MIVSSASIARRSGRGDGTMRGASYLKRLIPSAGRKRPLPDAPARFPGFAPNFVYRYITVPSITAGQARALGAHYSKRALRLAEAAIGDGSG
jgi:hypothetical protein